MCPYNNTLLQQATYDSQLDKMVETRRGRITSDMRVCTIKPVGITTGRRLLTAVLLAFFGVPPRRDTKSLPVLATVERIYRGSDACLACGIIIVDGRPSSSSNDNIVMADTISAGLNRRAAVPVEAAEDDEAPWVVPTKRRDGVNGGDDDGSLPFLDAGMEESLLSPITPLRRDGGVSHDDACCDINGDMGVSGAGIRSSPTA